MLVKQDTAFISVCPCVCVCQQLKNCRVEIHVTCKAGQRTFDSIQFTGALLMCYVAQSHSFKTAFTKCQSVKFIIFKFINTV